MPFFEIFEVSVDELCFLFALFKVISHNFLNIPQNSEAFEDNYNETRCNWMDSYTELKNINSRDLQVKLSYIQYLENIPLQNTTQEK